MPDRLTLSSIATSTPLLLAQHWTKVPLTGIPLTPDGKPDMFAPVPRTPAPCATTQS
ncbi:MAG TPA: hypothetical protein VH702_16685 [Vicinamibacterales bacterium]